MTTFDSNDALMASPKRPGLLLRIFLALAAYRARRARQQVLFHLSQYDAHMLRDMGLDPRDMEDAFNQRSRSLLFHPVRPEGR